MKSNMYADLHTHILPGVDDGAANSEMSETMLRMAYEEGVRLLAATSHYIPGSVNVGSKVLTEQFQQLKLLASEKFPDMQLILGNELYYREGIIRDLKEGKALTYQGTSYVLVEFRVSSDYGSIFGAVKKLTEAGYKPVIAHAERYAGLHRAEQKVEELIRAGAYIQVNAGSLTGAVFDKKSRYWLKLAGRGMVHFLGSDCHDDRIRKPVYRSAAEILEKKAGAEAARKITSGNIEYLLQDRYIV